MADISAPGVDVTEWTTSELVWEFTSIKCADARGIETTASRHALLGLIVDELRKRNVLD